MQKAFFTLFLDIFINKCKFIVIQTALSSFAKVLINIGKFGGRFSSYNLDGVYICILVLYLLANIYMYMFGIIRLTNFYVYLVNFFFFCRTIHELCCFCPSAVQTASGLRDLQGCCPSVSAQ